jgi:hypothetical protein
MNIKNVNNKQKFLFYYDLRIILAIQIQYKKPKNLRLQSIID